MSKDNLDNGGISGPYLRDVVALTAGSSVAVDVSEGSQFTLTPGEDESITASNVTEGETVVLVVTTSGTTSRTLTFSTGFKATGTLATGTTSGKVFVLTFVGVDISGTVTLVEASRTTAQ